MMDKSKKKKKIEEPPHEFSDWKPGERTKTNL